MFRFVVLVTSLLLLSVDCNAGARKRPVASAHPSNLTWTIEIMTTAGFTGHGVGSVIINAGGSITAVDLAKTCSSTLSEGDRLALNQLLQRANAEEWNFCYVKAGNPTGCCDQVQYRFTLKDLDAEHREHVFSSYWFNDSESRLPTDLSDLFKAAWEIRRRTLDSCK